MRRYLRRYFLGCLCLLTLVGVAGAAEFETPVMLKAGGKAIRVEDPGYACPGWADVDGDGKKDLLVGQFAEGKIHFYKNLGDNKFADRAWLKANGEVATVPGVW